VSTQIQVPWRNVGKVVGSGTIALSYVIPVKLSSLTKIYNHADITALGINIFTNIKKKSLHIVFKN